VRKVADKLPSYHTGTPSRVDAFLSIRTFPSQRGVLCVERVKQRETHVERAPYL
jgi:hypothetical protein